MLPRLVGDAKERAARGSPGVVHEYVDTPVGLDRRVNESLDLVRVHHVHGDGGHLAAGLRPDLGRRVFEDLRSPRGDDHARALSRHAGSGSFADTLTPACHNCHFAR